jgi:hypothetical protein
MSTPTNPPEKVLKPEWKKMTDRTATALKPSMSGLYVSAESFIMVFVLKERILQRYASTT